MPGHRDGEGEPEYRPHLVCRAFVGDTGARPLVPNSIFYESPDIWVVAPDGSDVPAVGAVNKVNVQVWNLGLAPSYGTVVELFWCNPSVGVNLAAATPIGSKTTTLQAGQHKTLTFPWTPVFVNDGHECLIAQVYDPVSDNLVAPFNPVADRHVAQKNLNLVEVAAGHQIDLHFFAANLSSRPRFSQIDLEMLTGRALQELAKSHRLGDIREFQGAESTITAIETGPVRNRIALEAHPVAAVFRESMESVPLPYSRQLLQQALAALPPGKDAVQVERRQAPQRNGNKSAARMTRETRTVEIPPRTELRFTLSIRLPDGVKPGTYTGVRVVERSNDRIAGGVSYLVRSV